MSKTTERNLKKELEYYSNLLAQHEKNITLQNSTTNKKYLTCSASGSMSSSFLKNEYNVIPNHAFSTNFSKVRFDMHHVNKNKSTMKFSRKIITPKSFSSNIIKKDINKIVKISPASTPIYKSESFLKSKIKTDLVKNLSVKNSNKSDSKKLMGEIMALTNKLKMKSGTYSNSDKIENSNLKLLNPREKIKDASSGIKCKGISSLPFNVSTSTVRNFDRNSHVYKKNESFATANSFSGVQSKNLATQYTKLVAQSFNKNMDPVSNKIKTTNFSVVKKPGKFIEVQANPALKKESIHKNFKKNSVEAVLKKETSNVIDTSKEKNILSGLKTDAFSYCAQNKKVVTAKQKSIYSFAKANYPKKDLSYPIKPLPLSSKNSNSKYKVINKNTPKSSLKKLYDKNTLSKSLNCSSAKKNLYRLDNNQVYSSPKSKSCIPYKSMKKSYSNVSSLFNKVSRKSIYLTKKQPCNKMYSNKVLIKGYPNTLRMKSKYHLNKIGVSSSSDIAKLSGLNDSLSNHTLNNDVDVDLLLELAAEKKKRLAMRNLYKSKNRIIHHSVQAKTVRMIKSKYYKTNKRSLWKNRPVSQINCGGFSRNYLQKNLKFGINCNKRKFKSKKHFLKSHQKKKLCLQKKKIVNLEGEKFIVGSTGKTLKKLKSSGKTKKTTACRKTPLKKYTFIKNNSPTSKAIASRVLNRSINLVLSASVKKKTEKVNTYCMFYNRFGRCNKGMECSYVHDPSKIAVCTRFLRGTCKNDKCLFSHETDPGKMAICTFFLQDACTKDDCPYRHEKLPPQAELCKAFVQGYCANGKECQKAHVLICLKYIQGICDKGKGCIFPHPDSKGKKTSDSTNLAKEKDNIFENVLRYYEVLPNENSAKGLVVPARVRNLPEQPSFISLTMDENL